MTQYELCCACAATPASDPAGAFIEIAERSGVIRDIDLWVVQVACRIIRRSTTRAAGLPHGGQRLRSLDQ